MFSIARFRSGVTIGFDLGVESFRREQPQRHLAGIVQMQRQFFHLRRPAKLLRREGSLDLGRHAEDVFAGAQRVRAEVGARAIRIARLQPIQRPTAVQ